MTILRSEVTLDEFVSKACEPFDYKFTGVTEFTVPPFAPPADFALGLIVGPSGSGKSSLLKEHFGGPSTPAWDTTKAIVSQVGTSPEDAVSRLSAVGLNSVPSWCKPRHVLSNGEGFRADLAQVLKDGAVVDEFTSVVDRNVAKAASVGLRRFVDRYQLKGVVVASCHYDIIEWMQPDWVFDVSTGVFAPRGSLQPRPKIELEIVPCDRAVWPIFAPHHYLSAKIGSSAHCWSAWWGDTLVGFSCTIPFPHGSIKNARREHRTVILPDFQGLGLGVRLSDAIAQHTVEDLGHRYYSKTAHPRMGEYRDRHPHWKSAIRHGGGDKKLSKMHVGTFSLERTRICWSHEWVAVPKTVFGGGASVSVVAKSTGDKIFH